MKNKTDFMEECRIDLMIDFMLELAWLADLTLLGQMKDNEEITWDEWFFMCQQIGKDYYRT